MQTVQFNCHIARSIACKVATCVVCVLYNNTPLSNYASVPANNNLKSDKCCTMEYNTEKNVKYLKLDR